MNPSLFKLIEVIEKKLENSPVHFLKPWFNDKTQRKLQRRKLDTNILIHIDAKIINISKQNSPV